MCFAPPVTEYVPLHSKSLSKSMARASGGANNMRPLSWEGAQTEKILSFLRLESYWWSVFFLIGNFVGVYLKQEVKGVKTNFLGQNS